jgi:hypothetical protein
MYALSILLYLCINFVAQIYSNEGEIKKDDFFDKSKLINLSEISLFYI